MVEIFNMCVVYYLKVKDVLELFVRFCQDLSFYKVFMMDFDKIDLVRKGSVYKLV